MSVGRISRISQEFLQQFLIEQTPQVGQFAGFRLSKVVSDILSTQFGSFSLNSEGPI